MVVIDEFQVDYLDRITDDDDFGYQLSLSYKLNSHITAIAFNHMYSSDYLGIHYGIATNYEVYGLPILSQYGPQTQRSELTCYFNIPKLRLKGWTALYSTTFGENRILGTAWNAKASLYDREGLRDITGFESEILINISQRYFGFVYVDLNSMNTHKLQIALAYRFDYSG